ncbi:MAG TPA: ATP-dependent Clp protease adapter ClpS [Castellaniella sp.]|nr:ATP-dependent Clp protease adapter ClpS [Castellaniella sp.]
MPIDIRNQRELLQVAVPTRVAPPPMYQVVLLNDDYTPMDFVVLILREVFRKSDLEAERIMLKVHHEGRGVCGIYTRDVASTRVDLVRRMAHADQHPLQCVMEPIAP